ncbi:hypothetical protein AAHC03_022511 [Spirometra sp. Aus1]
MPWPGSKVLKKLKSRKSDTDSCFSLPPPGPSLFKSAIQAQQPVSESVGRRNVLFRDNRLPDGSSASQQFVPRPRLPSYSGSLDYCGPQVRSSPATPVLSGRMPPAGTAIPSLASYPVSYQSNCYVEYDGMSARSASTLQRPRLTNLSDFNLPTEPVPTSFSARPPPPSSRRAFDADIPSPDYPILPSSTSSNSNRDSGLDSDSRSSSGPKPTYSPFKRGAEHGQGWNFANGDQHLMFDQPGIPDGRPKLINQNASTQSRPVFEPRHQHSRFTADEEAYRSLSNPRHCQYNRPSMDYFETSSVRDWNLPRDRQPLPKTSSLMNVHRVPEVRDRYRSRDYEVPLSTGRNRHCSSCSCLNSIRDEVGQYTSVGTNTETPSATETLRSSLKRVQLPKTPLNARRDREKTSSLAMTWQSLGSEEERQSDEEADRRGGGGGGGGDSRGNSVSRPAYQTPPISLPISSPNSRRANRKPPTTGGLRLPRSQPLKAQPRGQTVHRTFNEVEEAADDDDFEEGERFTWRREGKEAADRSPAFGETSDFQEYSPTPSNRRTLRAEEQEDRSFVRI